MKVSIFTPTNSAAFLLPLYNSLKDQDFDEWVLVLNSGMKINNLPIELLGDGRFKIVEIDCPARVGALKKLACHYCTGDVLVEVDHDDLLTSGAINAIRRVFEDPEVVFAYSGFAEFNHGDNSPREHSPVYGWKYNDIEINDVQYRTPIHPPNDPYHASIIYFAPNHLRAWRKDVYDAVGGHNADMNVLDDQDLMCLSLIHI